MLRTVTNPQPAAIPSSASVRSILIWIVLACILPGVIGTSAILGISYLSERAKLEGDTIHMARALSQALDAELLKAESTTQALATSGYLMSKDFAAFYAQAKDLLQQTEVGNNFVLTDSTGQQLVNTIRPFPGALPRHGNPGQLQRVFDTGKPVISDIYIGGALGLPIMSIDVPVLKDGRVIYDLSIGLFPERLGRIPLAQRLPPDWVISIFDTRGVIAWRTHAADKFVGKTGAPLLLRQMAHAAEGMVETNTLEGIPISALFSRSPTTQWSVAIGIPTQQFTAKLQQRFLVLLSSVGVLIAVGVGLASIFAGRIAASLHALIAPATALGSGAPVIIPPFRLREVAEVGAAIGKAGNLLALHALAAKVYRSQSDGIFATDSNGTIVSVNPAYCAITGYTAEELVGANPRIFRSDRHDTDFYRAIWEALGQHDRWHGEIWNQRKNGSLFLVNETITTIRDDSGQIAHYVGVINDITEAKQEAESIRYLAYHDPLTKLANRALFMDRLQQEMFRSHRNKLGIAVLFIDLDHFKEINDQFGHETGDELLKTVAARLLVCVREADTVARFGGDEFAAILSDINGRADAARVAQKMLDELCRSFSIGQHELRISASIGVALYPADGAGAATLLKAADTAMYEAKRGGRNAYCFAAIG